jgi:hypothetical protein
VSEKGKKRVVEVDALGEGQLVVEGEFTTFVLEKHVLS